MKCYYCYGVRKNLFDNEIEYAKALGKYIFYDPKRDGFFDKDNNQIDIRNKKIFPRAGVSEAKRLVEAVIRHGGDSVVKKDDYDITLNWPYYLKTKRNNIILSGEQIISNPELITRIFGDNTVFFKTKHKNFSRIINTSNFFKKDLSFIQALEEHSNDDFIISDAVTIEKDENGPLEYRAFVIDGEIFNISRISYNLLSNIPKAVIEILKEAVTSLKGTGFPESYVIDLFTYIDKDGNKVTDVLECNPIVASGTYLYNSIFQKQTDLEHKCPSTSIPPEKNRYRKHNHYSFNSSKKVHPSIFYHLPGGFAADLTSFSLFGIKSSENINNYFYESDDEIAEPKKLSRIKEGTP